MNKNIFATKPAETIEEAVEHYSLHATKRIKRSNQISGSVGDKLDQMKQRCETFSTMLSNNYKTLQGQSVGLFSASHCNDSPKTVPITKDYDDDGVSPIKFN